MAASIPPSTLEAALAPVLPPDAARQRDQSGRLERVTVTNESSARHRVLAVEVRPDGDYQMDFWYADDLRGPAEALFVVTPGREREVADAVADLVRGLLEERVVLVLPRGWAGGREFPTVEELATMDRARLTAVYSWKGTFDWQDRNSTAPARKLVRAWMVVGVGAALLTALLLVAINFGPSAIRESAILAFIGVPLSFGVILASVPFGGLHNGPPVVPMTVLSSVINGVLWGGAFWLWSLWRDVR